MGAFFLADPRLKGLEMGSKPWFEAQREVIRSKPLVRQCYDLWYQKLLSDVRSVPSGHRAAPVLELGSGSSYLKEQLPEVITSDVAPGIAERVIDGRKLPFPDGSLRAILLTHVFHHIPDVEMFLSEARRALVPGGVISMVDVTHTPFGRLFFSKFHPEPYDDRASRWQFPEGHSMLDSNQALAWIVFFRDRDRFETLFPDLALEQVSFLPWFTYVLSGGVNLRSMIPDMAAPAARLFDALLKPLDPIFALHWHLTVRKTVSSR